MYFRDDDDFTARSKSNHQRGSGGRNRHHSDEYQHNSDSDDAPKNYHNRSSTIEFEKIRERDVKQEGHEAKQDANDPRLRRLMAAKASSGRDRRRHSSDDSEPEDGGTRHRKVHQPEVLSEGEEEEDDNENQKMELESASDDSDDTSGDDEMDEEAVQRRRELMRQRALARAQIGVGQEEILEKEEEQAEASEEEEGEETSEEETTDSEEEEGARLKPVFVRKKDRLTVQEKEREDAKQRQLEREAEEAKKARRRETLRIVETTNKKEIMERKEKESDPEGLNEVITDDENEEVEYESWKLRELKRMKRDRDEKEALERENAETERLRNMTEEERRQELRNNPREVTNKAAKGKYKFMQKYYHRGAFFMEKEEGLFKRDCSSATLEDNFDKTVLPKVMQVKNFGRSGRTKYTHLVDQDTTQFDAAWSQETTQSLKFQLNHAAGMKGGFERPSVKQKK